MRRRSVLAIACATQFMTVMDVSVVNVALPDMQRALGMSEADLQWVINAYALAFAGFLLVGGRAGDVYGQRRILLAGLWGYTASSLVAGFAMEGWHLVAARGVQGLSAALLAPVALSLLTTTFEDAVARAKALAWWAGVAAVGGAIGSVLGGLLTGLLGWRWVMFFKVPIGVVLIAAALVVLVARRPPGRRRPLDLPGAFAVTIGMVCVVWALVGGQQVGWTSTLVLAAIVVGVVSLGVFGRIEAVSADPLMPFDLFRTPGLVRANTLAIISGAVMPVVFFVVSLHVQRVLGMDPLTAGVALLPAAFGLICGSSLAPRLLHRLGPSGLSVGGSLLSVGGLWWLSGISATGAYATDVLGPLFLAMVGLGLGGLPLTLVATTGVGVHRSGIASALLNAARQVGGSLGLAVLIPLAASQAQTLRLPPNALSEAAALSGGFSVSLQAAALLVLVGAALGSRLPGRSPRPSPHAPIVPAPASVEQPQPVSGVQDGDADPSTPAEGRRGG